MATSPTTDPNDSVSILSTSELWTIVVCSFGGAQVLDGRDLYQLSLVCHGAFSAVSAAKTKAKWAVNRFGATSALPSLYKEHPRLIVPIVVDALVSLRAPIPRAFVLLLYQQAVKRRLEWRAMELEAQRLTSDSALEDKAVIAKKQSKRDIHEFKEGSESDAESHTDQTIMDAYTDDNHSFDEQAARTAVALVPLPSYDEIKPVPYPDPVPTTNTQLLKPGVRDYIIEIGEDIYGRVFLAANAPLVYAERISLLPDELHWTANISQVVGMNSPAAEWPFDDTAMFTYLLKYGMDVKSFLSSDVAKEFTVIPTPETANADGSFAPASAAASSSAISASTGFATATVSTGFAVSRHQEAWKRICESIWALIHKHAFLPEFVIGDALGSLKRFLRNGVSLDASHHGDEATWVLSEVLHFDEKLGRLLCKSAGIPQEIVENELYYWALVDSRIQHPLRKHTQLPFFEELHMRKQLQLLRRYIRNHASKLTIQRTSLAKVDFLVEALSITPETLLTHFTIPEYQTYTTSEAKTVAGSAPVASAADDYMDLMNAYTLPGPQLLTQIGALTGSIPWAVWNYLVTRYINNTAPTWKNSASTGEVLSILLHDLTVRRASHGVEDDPARRWFGEKEADQALGAFLKAVQAAGGVVKVFPATVVEVLKRVVEGVELLERLERVLVEGGLDEAGKKEWIDLLNECVVESSTWQDVVKQSSTTEEVLNDSIKPEVRFYWAVVSIIEDTSNPTAPPHKRFAAWVKELEAAQSSLATSSLSKETISASRPADPPAPSRFASVTSSFFNSFSESISNSTTLQSFNAKATPVAASINQSAQKLGHSIASSKVAEQVSAGATNLFVTTKESKEEVIASVEEKAQEHRKASGSVELISGGEEKKKEAWDKTWDKYASRLSTAKK
ncbi:hypothetical protein BCR33DRAFT_720902 [Rhizoclosmatium globosum]|uniref:Uncharacterized protein n=1 Tax=Rhizoclosmatium globosum TaxID=329046 RepID=A0A1Y2BU31_9FUNG|nr:hypothetical protein BCR33DRAFT_720902 [Rhizoclosmatium globosum]|eukprot:ORY38194.1 hypothetical protein BCR33DRAFT_720902 [Rhizoclosmatium globosum]